MRRRDLLRALPLVACTPALSNPPRAADGFDDVLAGFDHDEHADLRAVSVDRGGRRVASRTYNGARADELHDVRSAGKSITSLLAGAAFDRGMLRDLADPVQRYLPAARGSAFADVPLRDLLDMRSGVDADDEDPASPGREDLMDAAPDPVAFAWSVPRATAPGLHYRYNSLAAYVAGLVVQQACGQDLEAFARDALFAPLGITRWHWARDAAGNVKGQGNLSLAVHDLLRIGRLLADGGRHGETRVLGREWIEGTQRPAFAIGDTDPFASHYGLYWYHATHAARGGPVRVLFASGNGGNKIYVVPALDVVVAITSRAYGRGYGQRRSQAILQALLAVA
ncbi:serine hydrolase domain-containing protein [Nannocystis bainbridge]|uniref:Serine hydrolase n=1 Tax=Nannocystis bainbridge TaxID=2995303 RepID=A0ABT5DWQ9_9BACT|nr:serine hydrolase domain-containing protein [Nannocystis bainbridge]MDC0718079.1 serine hydrolase [Nannocystis bainbridge]